MSKRPDFLLFALQLFVKLVLFDYVLNLDPTAFEKDWTAFEKAASELAQATS